jgi:hypothetical protein
VSLRLSRAFPTTGSEIGIATPDLYHVHMPDLPEPSMEREGRDFRRLLAVIGLGIVSIALLYVTGAGFGAAALWVCERLAGYKVGEPREFLWFELMAVGRDLFRGGPGALSLAMVLLLGGFAPALISAPALVVRPGDRPGIPLKVSMLGAAILGGLIALLLVASAIELFAVLRWSSQEYSPMRFLMHPAGLCVGWLVTGSLWALALRSAGSHRDPRRIDRAVRWLFAGSLVELAIAAPTFAIAARRDNCFCGWMSWWGIAIGTSALLLLCGPMIFLMRSFESRVQWMRSACPKCGYPQRSRGDACSECGHAYRQPAPQ